MLSGKGMETEKSTFESLKVWKEARTLRNEISQLVKEFPDKEKYKLSDQMIRASRSITANMAEGHGRYHYQENIQFCRQARGSLFELLDHITVAFDEEYIENKEFKKLRTKIFIVIRLLNGYVRFLKNKKSE
jgi:four helix bundle protein